MTRAVIVTIVCTAVAGGTLRAADAPSIADAMKARETARVDQLLQRKADVNAPQPDGTTALHWAAYWDDVATARRLLAAGAAANTPNRYRETPLSIAAGNANATLLDLLLNAGADANSHSGEGETVLMTAARKGSVEAVRTLLAHGATPNAAEGWRKQTALMWAAGADQVSVVKTLLEAGAQIGAVAEGGFTALHYAARNGAIESGKFLIASGADVNQPLEGGMSPLMVAITNASYELAATMVEWGADVNDMGIGLSPLHQLMWSYHPPYAFHPPGPEIKGKTGGLDAVGLFSLLLDWGADANAGQTKSHPMGYKMGQVLDYTGLTPLMLAARFQDLDLMRLLISYGADPTLRMKNGTTLLMVATGITAFMGEMPATKPGSYMDTVRLALEICACGVNDQNNVGWTALHGAVHREGNEAIRFLVSNGADLNLTTNEEDQRYPGKGQGKTPLRLAEGQYVAASYKYYCDQQVVLRELMKRPTAECVRIPPGETEPLRGAAAR